MAYLAEHHDFSKDKRNRKSDQCVLVPATPNRKSAINPPTITAVRDYQPAFIEGEPDSISVHLKKGKSRYNHPVANMNTSAFGHPTQNNSSYALKELFGVRRSSSREEAVSSRAVNKSKSTNFGQGSLHESQGGDNESDYSHKSGEQVRNVRQQGGGDPDDSDGDDSDEGKGNNPQGGPRKGSAGGAWKNNPFELNREEASPQTIKPPPEPQFDTKLKIDAIPTWDRNPESLRRWLLKINSLAKRSTIVFKQLGTLVPTRLTGPAEVWYYSQSVETRDRVEQDWNTLRGAIGEYYMNRAFLDKQKARANRAVYRDANNGRETPSEYVIRKLELLQFVYNYTDRELINEIMEGAPSYWMPFITPHLFQNLEEFQLSVKFHEDSLLKLGNSDNSYNRQGSQNSLVATTFYH